MTSPAIAGVRGFRNRVNEALGREAVLDPAEAGAAYVEDAREGHGCAAAVVAPRSTSEVSRVVQIAASTGVRLVPQGANTGLVAAGVPADSSRDVILTLRALNRPPQIDAANRSAVVDAGVLLSRLNSTAAEFDLCFPIDLAADPSVGGMVAANAAGARFVRYGDVRRNLLGLEVVLGDPEGTVLDLMKPLWKNNTGLDLKQLFVGSSGSLGIVTRAVLALQPRPTVAIAALLEPADEAAVTEALLALECHAGASLSAFEGMSRAALQAAFDSVPSLVNPYAGQALPNFAVLVELSGGPGDTQERLLDLLATALARLCAGETPRLPSVIVGDPARCWAVRHAIPEALRRRGAVIACDISVSRGDWSRLRGKLVDRLHARWPLVEVCDFGHVGDGGLHFNLVWPHAAGAPPAGACDAIRACVFSTVVGEFGGSFSAEHGIGPRNADYYRRFTDRSTLRIAGGIQQLLCPARIGRVSFGDIR
jgi:FAD/FMN-containing dehydrogenase